ncbi:MAG: 4Fe-4S binding protein [Candidatus Freyarchaeum deiterrae]
MKTKRKIVSIDEEKCTGCGACIPDCPEGALQVIDGKARVIGDYLCDGLGACVGGCPQGAMEVIEREAEPYNERKAIEGIVKQGPDVTKAHLQHLKDHGQEDYLDEALKYLNERGIEINFDKRLSEISQVISGSSSNLRKVDSGNTKNPSLVSETGHMESELSQWPVQLRLVSPNAPFFANADLLVVADCVPYAYAGFHQDFLRGKKIVIGCPKFDDTQFYEEKLTQIFKQSSLKSITVVTMEVPCCQGLYQLIQEALKRSGKNIPTSKIVIDIKGNIKKPK